MAGTAEESAETKILGIDHQDLPFLPRPREVVPPGVVVLGTAAPAGCEG